MGPYTGEIGEIVKVERANCTQSVLRAHQSNNRADKRVKVPDGNTTVQ